MSKPDADALAAPDERQERAIHSGDDCAAAGTEAVIQRYVGNLAGQAILELCPGESTHTAPALCARYVYVTEDLDYWCGGAIGLFDVAIARGAFARVTRLAYLLEVIRHHLRPRGLLVFSGARARSYNIPRTAAMYHTMVTEAGFNVEEMVDAAGCVVFRARRR
jgi:hypothetical protein